MMTPQLASVICKSMNYQAFFCHSGVAVVHILHTYTNTTSAVRTLDAVTPSVILADEAGDATFSLLFPPLGLKRLTDCARLWCTKKPKIRRVEASQAPLPAAALLMFGKIVCVRAHAHCGHSNSPTV